jgi:hypothetical protein
MVMRPIPRQESQRVGRGCGPGVNQGCPWASASGHRVGTPLGSTLNRTHGRCGAHDTVAGIPPRGRARLLAARPRIGTTLRPCACRKVQDTGNLARGEFPGHPLRGSSGRVFSSPGACITCTYYYTFQYVLLGFMLYLLPAVLRVGHPLRWQPPGGRCN